MIGRLPPALRKLGKRAALLVGAVALVPVVVVPMVRNALTPACDDHHRFLGSGGVPGVWTVDADGSNERRIGDGERLSIAWSPDRSLMATVGPDAETGDDAGLHVMNADGSDRRTLIPAPVYTPDTPGKELPGTSTGESVSEPAWSPDGERLAFVARGRTSGIRVVDWNPPVDPHGADGDTELYVIDVDGANRVRLTDNEIYESEPTWSPGGERIAFKSDRGIETIRADGSGRQVIAHSGSHVALREADWSPDGTSVAFSALRHEDRRHPDGQGWIEEVELDNLNRRRLTPKRCHDSQPAWSPSGDRIAMTNRGIAVTDPDGSNRRQLTKGTHDYSATWSPDGKSILFRRGS